MEFRDAMLARHSCRAYTDQPVDQRALGMVLEAANAAPIGRRRYENVHLTVIRDKALLRDITENARNVLGDPQADPLYGAPVMILVSVREEEGQISPVNIANAACVVENMHLAAADLGLGSCYIWGAVQTMLQSFDLLYKLRLDEGFWPVSALILGHEAETRPARTPTVKTLELRFLDGE
ncbi:MAG: nitroreductase family protein [Clostridia bacterium]|nr:nitroreductase family protein [Clostridia bacterium]